MVPPEHYPAQPWGPRARVLEALLFGELVAIWIVGLWGYARLPERVPLHFGIDGSPTSYGSKSVLLGVPLAFSIAPVVVFLVARFRFVLLSRFPYLVNLPAFFLHAESLPPVRRSQWVNRYFELMLAMGVVLTAYLLALEIVMGMSMISGRLGDWSVVLITAVPLVIVGGFVYRLKALAAELTRQARAETTIEQPS